MLYIRLFIEREKNIGQSAPECPFNVNDRSTSVGLLETIRKQAARQSPNCIKNKKIKYGEKRFSVWRMELLHPANMARSWHWFRQVTASCNVAGGSGMTCHGIRPNVLHLVSILTISPQSTCHCAPVCEMLSKSENPQQKKMTSCRLAILDFRDPIMGSLKSPSK